MTLLDFPREIGLKRTTCLNQDDWKNYIKRLGTKASCYTSLYSFKETKEGKIDYDTVVIDRAWWDFDSNEKYSIEQVKLDVSLLLRRLKGDIRLVATGRGFHVHQLFDKPVIGKNWMRKLQQYQKHMARGLVSLDGVGYPEKLTRIPGTYNPKRGRWAVPISPSDFLLDPLGFKVPKVPTNEHKPLDPFVGVERNGNFDFKAWIQTNNDVLVVPEPVGEVTEVTDAASVPMIPCLSKAINTNNPPHHVRVALVQHMAEFLREFSHPDTISEQQYAEIEEVIYNFVKDRGWSNFKPSLSRQGIRTNLRYNNSPKCSWYISRDMCPGKCWRYDGSATTL
tara:strand:- start:8275 stop:9285 length:1011 start_codon:yes stop_codon:yes gene_type:complete